jgi:peptidoglycan/LPS O-acetylase OafA/YrhL
MVVKISYGILTLLAFAIALFVSQWAVILLPDQKTHDPHRYVPLDGIRGFLALGVFVHHCCVTWSFLQTGSWDLLNVNLVIQLGRASVALFFMITAFLFWTKILESGGVIEWRTFAISRLFRIYPLYGFVLAIVCLAVGFKTHWTLRESPVQIFGELFRWTLFLQPDINRFPSTALIIAAVNWTLQYELWFYISLPLLGIAVVARRPIWMKVSSFLLVLLLFRLFRLWIPTAAAFLGGILAAYWVREPTLVRLSRTRWAAWAATVAIIGEFCLFRDAYHILPLAVMSFLFAVIASGNTLFGLLEMRSALWLGEISYSIYLLHGLILWIAMQNVFPNLPVRHPSIATFALAIATLTLVTVVVSGLTFIWVETPGIRFGRMLRSNIFRSQTQVIT